MLTIWKSALAWGEEGWTTRTLAGEWNSFPSWGISNNFTLPLSWRLSYLTEKSWHRPLPTSEPASRTFSTEPPWLFMVCHWSPRSRDQCLISFCRFLDNYFQGISNSAPSLMDSLQVILVFYLIPLPVPNWASAEAQFIPNFSLEHPNFSLSIQIFLWASKFFFEHPNFSLSGY